MCHFGGFVDTASHFWGEIHPPKNPNFGGVNGRFQAKRAKYSKFHLIDTTESILTKVDTTIETTKWSWVVQIGGGRNVFLAATFETYA